MQPQSRYFSALLALAVSLLAFSPTPAVAGEEKVKSTRSVTWTLDEQEVAGQPGGTVLVHLTGEVPDGWHTYTLKKYKPGMGPQSTVIKVEPKESATLVVDGVTYDPQPFVDDESTKAFGNPIDAFKGKFTIAAPLKIDAGVKGDSIKVTLKVLSTICNETNCLPQATEELTLTVSLKKKVSEAPKTQTFEHTGFGELDWALANQDAKVTGGVSGQIVLTVEGVLKNGWHTFAAELGPKLKNASATVFSVEPKELFSIDSESVADRPAKDYFDSTLHTTVGIYEEKVTFRIPVRISAGASLGAAKLKLNIKSQACSNKLCKQVIRSYESDVTIEAKSSAAEIIPTNTQKTGVDFTQGLLAFLLSAAAAGAISLLTPCVFPMIPITVSFFTKRNHVSHGRAVRDALIFSSGIIFTYVGLAFFLEFAFGRNIRELATNPWMNLAIFGIFVALAFSLFGFYELQLPSGLINKLNKSAHGGDSVFGLLLMGLVFTLTSFSCTGPFVGSVMLAAVNGDWVWPLLGMSVFATVFAAPFFFLALFPTALKSLPKSGGWLNSVKVVMGFVEIAAALKFLSSADLVWHWGILTHQVFVVLWLLIAVATALYILGVYKFPHDAPLKKRSVLRFAFAGMFFVIAGLLVADLAGVNAPLGEFADSTIPPREYPPDVNDDWESGIVAAKNAGKPVFFDFTGVTCTNCRKMENSMFKLKEVEEIMKNYVVIRLYTDVDSTPVERARSERNAKDQETRFKQTTLPFYAIVAPDGKVLETFPQGYTENVGEFTDFLKRGLPKTLAATH
ncbi:MAG: cytochrome c biogenesis protein CcdA [Planctomycetota bacterium]